MQPKTELAVPRLLKWDISRLHLKNYQIGSIADEQWYTFDFQWLGYISNAAQCRFSSIDTHSHEFHREVEGEGEEEDEEEDQEPEEEEEEEEQVIYIEEEEEEQNEIKQEVIFIEEEEDEEEEEEGHEKKEQVKEEEDDENNEEDMETKEMLQEAALEQVAEEVDATAVEEDEGDSAEGDSIQKLSEEGGVENGNDSEMDDIFHTAELLMNKSNQQIIQLQLLLLRRSFQMKREIRLQLKMMLTLGKGCRASTVLDSMTDAQLHEITQQGWASIEKRKQKEEASQFWKPSMDSVFERQIHELTQKFELKKNVVEGNKEVSKQVDSNKRKRDSDVKKGAKDLGQAEPWKKRKLLKTGPVFIYLSKESKKKLTLFWKLAAASDSLWAGNHYETSIYADEVSHILEQEAIANSTIDAYAEILLAKYPQSKSNGDDKTRRKMYDDDLHNVLLLDSVIFPIHEDDHWTLLVLEVLKGTWCFYDSMQARGKQMSNRCKAATNIHVTAYLEERWERFSIEPKVRIEPRCSQQPPGSDCGIIVCNIMKHFVLKEEVQDTISNEDCNKIRAKILAAFITMKRVHGNLSSCVVVVLKKLLSNEENMEKEQIRFLLYFMALCQQVYSGLQNCLYVRLNGKCSQGSVKLLLSNEENMEEELVE
ncbi:hypothetical protein RHMOL_Rhmol09G0106200 [Rhododendron molle]|uniref:Uncharacterized protein n=1 Tax=Rhododendron molle TaxID=49168 RepID=A0ACC0MBX8_RHOML|nr:hypothetical protein RHMOL_Rhmol09G0106200 [Rhododendron molle]